MFSTSIRILTLSADREDDIELDTNTSTHEQDDQPALPVQVDKEHNSTPEPTPPAQIEEEHNSAAGTHEPPPAHENQTNQVDDQTQEDHPQPTEEQEEHQPPIEGQEEQSEPQSMETTTPPTLNTPTHENPSSPMMTVNEQPPIDIPNSTIPIPNETPEAGGDSDPPTTTIPTTEDTPVAPKPPRTLYDRFDDKEESPQPYQLNVGIKRKPPPKSAPSLIQPGRARDAARQLQIQSARKEEAKKDVQYDTLQQQWSAFTTDKQNQYPHPDAILTQAIKKLDHVNDTLATKAEPSKKIRSAYAAAKLLPDSSIPSTYKQAISHPDSAKWLHGIQEEMNTHHRNNTWDLVDIDSVPDRKLIGCRWVFTIKTDVNNQPTKWKARLVAQGFSQQPGKDYEETYAPVASLPVIRLLIAIAVQENLQVHQMDVTGAYLYGKVDQPIYMRLPPGIYDDQRSTKACRLNKALYGLRQSGRIWYDYLCDILHSMSFKSCYWEPTLYHSSSLNAIISVYVDDLIILTPSTDTANIIKSRLNKEFEMKDLGQVSHILGMHVNYNQQSGHATIDQSGYIAKALDDLNLQNVKRRIIPMNTTLHLSLDDGPSSTEEKEEMMLKPYAQAVGKLNWISQASRPDIAYATNVCSRFTQNPGIKHWNAIKQIFGFLKNTINTQISFSRKSGSIEGFTKGVIKPDNFEGFVDADWAGCSDTSRSTSGCVFTCSGGAIAWCSKRQKCVATSTAEVEYTAFKHGTDIALWLRNVMKHIERPFNSGIPIKTDNMGALTNLLNPGLIIGLKHVRIHYHAGKERHEKAEVKAERIGTHDQLADIFTKALDSNKIRILCGKMGLTLSETTFREENSQTNPLPYTQQEECQDSDTGAEHTAADQSDTNRSKAMTSDTNSEEECSKEHCG